MGKILTSKQFEEDLKKLHPFSNFTILEYNGMSNPLKILCLDCNKILDFSRAEKAKTTINLCKEKHFYSQKDKAEFFSKQYDFEILEWNTERKRYAKILCKKCGKVSFRHHTHIITNPNFCPECSVKCESQKLTLKQAQEKIDDIFGKENFNLLEYVSYHEKVLIKHNCGFTWSIRFSDFLKSRGCPKCHKNKSKGEQKIEEWLIANNIDFIAQYPLLPPLNRFKFDFFLPKLNIAIEYQGEQHYKDKNNFWEPLNVIQKRDKIKKDYCEQNNIELFEISYLDYNKISQLLSSKFND